MVFNILARNQDDHAKNHAFLMDTDGTWALATAHDIIFAYKRDSRWVDKQQMRCNGKRDGFTMDNFVEVAKAADIRRPEKIIREVESTLDRWPRYADEAELPREQANAIPEMFRQV